MSLLHVIFIYQHLPPAAVGFELEQAKRVLRHPTLLATWSAELWRLLLQ